MSVISRFEDGEHNLDEESERMVGYNRSICMMTGRVDNRSFALPYNRRQYVGI